MHKVLDIAIEKDILQENRKLAEENRKLLRKHGVKAFDVLGAVGSGKTLIIERIADFLKKNGMRVGAIAGDVAGNDDYRRFKKHRMQSVNINTGKECHLDAHGVSHALTKFDLDKIDVLFIENVGNLVCPADFELGAEKRIVVISTTEGDDMVRKHPMIFAESDITILNKIDLAKYVDVDVNIIVSDFKRINPNGKMILTNAKKGVGINEIIRSLKISPNKR
ncbi:MAG: hydrogenase nickel incorporation protein HypB [Thermoplasmata archaeon]